MFIPDPGTDFFPSRIPDPNCLHPGSRILINEFKYFKPKKTKKWFLSSKKMIWVVHPGSRIRMLTFYPSRIPDPGVKKAPDPGSRIRIRNTVSKGRNNRDFSFRDTSSWCACRADQPFWYMIHETVFCKNISNLHQTK